MEFQEALVRVVLKSPVDHKKRCHTKDSPKSGFHRWKISFHKPSSSSASILESKKSLETPEEFLCPVSGCLMSDPVIVSSGHTFDRACVNACNTLSYIPLMADGNVPDFSTVISNLALKTAILNWGKKNSLDPPKPLNFFFAEKLVRAKMQSQQQQPKSSSHINQTDIVATVNNHNSSLTSPVTELARRPAPFYSSSDDSFGYSDSTPPLQLTTRPSCLSSTSSSSEIDTQNPNPEEEEIVSKLNCPLVFEVEETLISLRKQTRTEEESRVKLCTIKLLSALLPLITSRYTSVQVNAVALLVNLSLEKANKVVIVRSGLIPPLIHVLKGGFEEAQEHACGAIFSLALDDNNKLAIGALGALPPLLHMLRSQSERTRHDSALSLYHLSFAQTNRTKLIKIGSVPVLVGLVKSGHLRSSVLLILSNLAYCADGRAALLDSGGVECVVELLRNGELESEATRECCGNMLYGLSHGGLRFKGLAKAAGAGEVLAKMEKEGSARTREKARKVLEVMERVEEEEDEAVDWEELLDMGSRSRIRFRIAREKDESCAKSSEF